MVSSIPLTQPLHYFLSTRTQLSLFVPHAPASELEAIRTLLDPIQASLIPAHVTLCREDELANIEVAEIRLRLIAAAAKPITLRFGRPVTFQEHGVLLPCVEGESEFHALRVQVLGSKSIRRQAPHITLAHPRNPRSSNNIPDNVAAVPHSLVITLDCVYRIQQHLASPWALLDRYSLADPESP